MQRRSLIATAGLVSLFGNLPPAFAASQTVVIGVTVGPHAEIMEFVKPLASKVGLTLRIVEFSDFVQPNAALVAGDLDANSFQHKPYMDQQNTDRGYHLVSAGSTVTFPLTYYTRKGYPSLTALPDGARIGIPNDPTNAGRALHILESEGLIRLAPQAGIRATVLDITENPKKVRIVEMDAAQLPRSLEDLDAAAINGSYAATAGLVPQRDGIAREAADGPYANILCVREEDAQKAWVQALVNVYRSPEVKAFVENRYKGGIVCAW